MEIHGKLNLVNSDVKSDGFASDKEFNRVIVNDLSEVDQLTLDRDVIVFNKEDTTYYIFQPGLDALVSYENNVTEQETANDIRPTVIIPIQHLYNAIYLDTTVGNYLTTDSELCNFGPIGSPEDFVIDWWMDGNFSNGTILYNGLDTGQVDLEINKNLLITTSGSILIKDPNYQANPTVQTNVGDDEYINVYRPRLKSITKVKKLFLTHVAIIRSGATTYLAIDGVIEASAPSVEYYHYNPVKIGAGYVGKFSGQLINFRVTKGTDFGWTTDFTPPNYRPDITAETELLLKSASLVDSSEKHTVTSVGTTPVFMANVNYFYYQLTEAHISNNVRLVGNGGTGIISARFPQNPYVGMQFEFQSTNKLILYGGRKTINNPGNYTSAKTIKLVPNESQKFVYGANGIWNEVSSPGVMSQNAYNLANPQILMPAMNAKYPYVYAVLPTGELHDFNTRLNVLSWGDVALSSGKDGLNQYSQPYLDCSKIVSGLTLPSYTTTQLYQPSFEFVFRLTATCNGVFINTPDSRFYYSFSSNRFVLYMHNMTSQYSYIIPFTFTVGKWYHISLSLQYFNSQNGYTGQNITSMIYEFLSKTSVYNALYVHSATGMTYYGHFRTVRPLPIDLIYFRSSDNSNLYYPNMPDYKSLFNEV